MAEWLPVVYGLDLSRRDAARGTDAVVVADPTGDLPAARVEAERVIAMLRARGGAPRLFSQREADLARVRPALEGASSFHFAGHASAGGHDGSLSALLFADGARLEVTDVLALEHPPNHVILSACEASRDERSEVATLGLAQAFVVAGSSSVLAADTRVPDAVALAVGVAVHEHLGPESDLATALTRALRDPSAPLSARMRAESVSFRVIAP
jgi:CHAT domain-containing protein